jgi:hypothetical protein
LRDRRAFSTYGGSSERFGLEQIDLLTVRLFAEGVAYGWVAFEHHGGGLLGDGAASRACLLSGLDAVAGSKVDPNPDARSCNSEQSREQITLYLCGMCKPPQPSATTDRTLVMRLGQRFESARRPSFREL